METEADINTTLFELKRRIRLLLGDRLERIVLCGSMARGDYDGNSDIDVADLEWKYLAPLAPLVLDEEMYNELFRRERRIKMNADTVPDRKDWRILYKPTNRSE